MRRVANFVPIKIEEKIKFFLQRRASDIVIRPGLLGLFGGGKDDGEDIFSCFYREVQEELYYVPLFRNIEYLGRYVDEIPTLKSVFYEIVGNSFEEEIKVCEGDYGVFMTIEEIVLSPDIAPSEKQLLLDLHRKISKIQEGEN